MNNPMGELGRVARQDPDGLCREAQRLFKEAMLHLGPVRAADPPVTRAAHGLVLEMIEGQEHVLPASIQMVLQAMQSGREQTMQLDTGDGAPVSAVYDPKTRAFAMGKAPKPKEG